MTKTENILISRLSKRPIHIQIASTDIIFSRILPEHKEIHRTMHRTISKIGDLLLKALSDIQRQCCQRPDLPSMAQQTRHILNAHRKGLAGFCFGPVVVGGGSGSFCGTWL